MLSSATGLTKFFNRHISSSLAFISAFVFSISESPEQMDDITVSMLFSSMLQYIEGLIQSKEGML